MTDPQNVLQNLTSTIYLADTDIENNLRLYHYTYCDNLSSESDKLCKGVIKDFDNNIVCQTAGYANEYLISDYDFSKNETFYLCEEGTMIRVFWHNGKWFSATHRKIHSHQSFWATQMSFGDQFDKTLLDCCELTFSQLTQSLNSNYVYCFIINSIDENRLTKFHQNVSKITIVAVYDKFGKKNESECQHFNISGIMKPILYEFNSAEQLEKDLDQSESFCGLINNDFSSKIVSAKSKRQHSLRNNNPNLINQYLQLLSNAMINTKDNDQIQRLHDYIAIFDFDKQYRQKFEKINFELLKVVHLLHNVYCQRYISKKTVIVNPMIHTFLKHIHNIYQTDRLNNKITHKKLTEEFFKQKTKFIEKSVELTETQKIFSG